MASSDTYLSYFLSLPPTDVWALFLLTLGRIVPIIALAPFFGAKMLPDTMKLGVGILLAPIFLPLLIAKSTGPIEIDLAFMGLLIKEIFLGTILGLLVAVPFYIAQSAGILIDNQRGSQSLQVGDPATQAQVSPIGLLYNNVLIAIFFSIGGPILFFNAVFSSYQVIPAEQYLDPSFFEAGRPLWHVFMSLLTTMITISLQLAAPSLIAMLLSDLFLGIANRMAPQVQISFLMWAFKAFIGVLLVWAGWWFVLKQLEHQTISWLKMLVKLIPKF